eukprot:TRINITY_DN8323_c0_g1_i1.p1 TRINITY_DN8323_c0_g1~~TRINITY_DN8323_c0_g1_i1.p1  ORF type:complete len:461 (-),score=75.90 TRINITY_DN8323_c0_g1_i1:162-1544(-)
MTVCWSRPSAAAVKGLAFVCALTCALDIAGLIPHGEHAQESDSLDVAKVCTLAGDDSVACQKVRESRWCPKLPGWALKEHRGATLAALALRGYDARTAERRAGCALKHFVSVAGDVVRFGDTSLPGIVAAQRQSMLLDNDEDADKSAASPTAEEVLSALVGENGPLALSSANKQMEVQDALMARSSGDSCDEGFLEVTVPFERYALEAVALSSILFVLLWLLLHCCCCSDGSADAIADRDAKHESRRSLMAAEDLRAAKSFPRSLFSALPSFRRSTGIVTIPESTKKINVCLGWDTRGTDVDVDASVVVFDARGREEMNAVYFGNKEAPGIVHSGDNLTGEGDGDDETISVTLAELPEDAQQLFVCITLYNPPGVTFKDVANAYCKLVDAEKKSVMTRFDFGTSANEQSGLIMARFIKKGNQWQIEKLGHFAPGRDFRDMLPEMVQIRDAAVDTKRRRVA